MTKEDEKNKKSCGFKKIFIPLLVVISLLVSGFFYVYGTYLGGIDTIKITDNKEELKIKPEVSGKGNDIINVAFFGIDTRANDYDGSRADTIMIASLDKVHKKIKLTSIMRDTYVNIPGEKYDKINHSYAYGGPELTIKTINQNFDMNIQDYVTVNFSALEKIVDAVGGVEINVRSNEIDHINSDSTAKVTAAGVQTLDGQQALSYSRIRYIGNGDYERTERQRTVLQNVINKVLNNKSLPQALSLIEILSPYIQTSLDNGELVGLATSVFTSGIKDMEDTRLPLEYYSNGVLWDEIYYLKPNTLSENVVYLHEFIYEEKGYVPSSTVEEISKAITSIP